MLFYFRWGLFEDCVFRSVAWCSFPVCSCLNVDRCNVHSLTTSKMTFIHSQGGWVGSAIILPVFAPALPRPRSMGLGRGVRGVNSVSLNKVSSGLTSDCSGSVRRTYDLLPQTVIDPSPKKKCTSELCSFVFLWSGRVLAYLMIMAISNNFY